MMIEPSSRRVELLDASYGYVLDHGLNGLSLRPLAAAIGTSPRVLLYLFGSKDGLLRELLDRARREHLAQMTAALSSASADGGFEQLAAHLWTWLSAPERRAMVRLTYEAFMLSIGHEPGPWAGFAAEAAQDWLNLLVDAQIHVLEGDGRGAGDPRPGDDPRPVDRSPGVRRPGNASPPQRA